MAAAARRPDPARDAPASRGRALRRVQAPRAERPSLPLLPPVEARAYDHEVRGRVLDLIEHTPADELFTAGMVVQYDEQHDETMLAMLELRERPRDAGAAADQAAGAACSSWVVAGATGGAGRTGPPRRKRQLRAPRTRTTIGITIVGCRALTKPWVKTS